MSAKRKPTRKPRTAAPATDWWDDFGKDLVPIFEQALYVANDVLAFDAHRAYVELPFGDSFEWSFPTGVSPGSPTNPLTRQAEYLGALRARGNKSRRTLPRLDRKQFPSVVKEPVRFVRTFSDSAERGVRHYCQVSFRLPIPDPLNPDLPRGKLKHVLGFLSVARRSDSEGPYSAIEAHQLKQVATLIEEEYWASVAPARAPRTSAGILNRLRLNMDYRRKYLQTANKDDVMREFLMKAVRVIHPDCPPDSFGSNHERPVARCAHAVHPVVKLLETSGTQLSLDGWLSTRPE
jgi:hypothetical protein